MRKKRIVILIAGFCILCTFLIMCFWLHDTKKNYINDNTRVDSTDTSEENNTNDIIRVDPTRIRKKISITFSVVDNDTLEIKGKGKLDELTFRIASFSISHDESEKIRRIVIEDGITELSFGSWFDLYNREKISKIIIADSVKTIGSSCFSDMCQLTTVDMGNGVQEIGSGAFEGCSSLREIKFSNSLKTLRKDAFRDCEALEHINLPESLIVIGKYCFWGCSALRQITLPDSVEIIRKGAFDECYNLEEMVLPAGLEKWDEPNWDTSALKRIINRSAYTWNLGTAGGKKIWYENGEKTKKIHAGETAIAKGKIYSIKYQLNGGKLVGEMPETYQYGEICPISAIVEKKGYYCVGWCDEKDEVLTFRNPEMSLGRYASGDLVLTPLLIKYRVKSDLRQGVKITLSDKGLPIVQEYYEIRYSENEDMTGAKSIIMDGESMIIDNLTKGKRYYIEFRWGSDEGNEGEREPLSPWMGKKSVLI